MFRQVAACRLLLSALPLISGCGTYVPQIQEFWEGPDITSDFEFRIKENIFCETVAALRKVNRDYAYGNNVVIPNNYGVQMQITLTVEESGGGLNPGVTFNHTLANAVASGATVGQSTGVGLGGTFSSTATRVDTSYSYYNVGKITRPGANPSCDQKRDTHGSSPFLSSELGIETYLAGAAKAAIILPSSAAPKNGGSSVKLDVYSYEIKFIIVSDGNVTPSWKLVNISANTGNTPFASVGRSRTHDLTLTFGPGTASAPSPTALQTHFTSQIVQSNQQLRRTN